MRTMKFAKWVAAGALAVLSSTAPFRADLAELEKQLDAERVSLSLKDASTKDLFAIYKDLLGVEVQYQCAEDRMIKTFAFEGITVRTSLNALCESTGLKWSLVEGTPPVLRITCGEKPPEGCARRAFRDDPASAAGPVGDKPAGAKANTVKVKKSQGDEGAGGIRVSINLNEADLASAMRMAARLLGAKLLMDTALSGKTVTLQLEEVPLSEFLDAACGQAGASWSVKEGEAKVLEVSKAK